MSFDEVDALVRAVLYEGYVLYPYRASSLKNRQRFTFGCVHPRAWCEAVTNGDAWSTRTECLVTGSADARVTVAVRFLQLVARVEGPVGSVWHEAIERTVPVPETTLGALAGGATMPFGFEGASREDEGIARVHAAIAGEIELRVEPAALGAHRLAIEIRNVTPFEGAPRTVRGHDRHAARDAALLRSFTSTHTLITVRGGELVSLSDPPEALRAAAASCKNLGAWPILVGEPGRRDTMLSSPIILEDHPRVAPESPSDLFDGTEIDEILTLRILTLTDEEKDQVRAADPRARALLDRTLALGPEALARLHGTSRRAERPDLRAGDRVRLHPRARADVFDLALAGMEATVVSVEHDWEGRVHVAVTVDADPGQDLGAEGQPGHRFFFGRDEVEPLA